VGPILAHFSPPKMLGHDHSNWGPIVEYGVPLEKLKLACPKVGPILAVENPPEMLNHDH
jgi:hypothetical protein